MGEGRSRGGGIEQKGKRTRGHGQQCGDCWGERGIRGLNGNGKNVIKITFKKSVLPLASSMLILLL